MAYKDGKYWHAEQDDDMRILLTTDSSTKKWLIAYENIIHRLRFMAVNILRRYYGIIDEKKADDLVTDAIATLLIRGVYNPDKPKLYSYCGTVIKRYFYDVLVREKNKSRDISLDKNYDSSDEHIVNKHAFKPDFDEFDLDFKQELFNELIIYIDNRITECDEVLERNRDETKFGRIRFREFLLLSKEYFNKYFLTTSISASSLADYILSNSDMKQDVVSRLMLRYFKIGSRPSISDNRRDLVDWLDKRNTSYLMDDYTPDTTNYEKNKKKVINNWYF